MPLLNISFNYKDIRAVKMFLVSATNTDFYNKKIFLAGTKNRVFGINQKAKG